MVHQFHQTGLVTHMIVIMAAEKTDIKPTELHQTAHTFCGQDQLKTTVSSVGPFGEALETLSTQVHNTNHDYKPNHHVRTTLLLTKRIYPGTSDLLACVDLKTGELLWEVNTTKAVGSSRVPSFGYYYSDDNPNEHGIANPGWIFSSNYATGYQPERGIPYLTITGVPHGFETPGVAGENLRFVLSGSNSAGYYLGQWNSSRVFRQETPRKMQSTLAQ